MRTSRHISGHNAAPSSAAHSPAGLSRGQPPIFPPSSHTPSSRPEKTSSSPSSFWKWVLCCTSASGAVDPIHVNAASATSTTASRRVKREGPTFFLISHSHPNVPEAHDDIDGHYHYDNGHENGAERNAGTDHAPTEGAVSEGSDAGRPTELSSAGRANGPSHIRTTDTIPLDANRSQVGPLPPHAPPHRRRASVGTAAPATPTQRHTTSIVPVGASIPQTTQTPYPMNSQSISHQTPPPSRRQLDGIAAGGADATANAHAHTPAIFTRDSASLPHHAQPLPMHGAYLPSLMRQLQSVGTLPPPAAAPFSPSPFAAAAAVGPTRHIASSVNVQQRPQMVINGIAMAQRRHRRHNDQATASAADDVVVEDAVTSEEDGAGDGAYFYATGVGSGAASGGRAIFNDGSAFAINGRNDEGSSDEGHGIAVDARIDAEGNALPPFARLDAQGYAVPSYYF